MDTESTDLTIAHPLPATGGVSQATSSTLSPVGVVARHRRRRGLKWVGRLAAVLLFNAGAGAAAAEAYVDAVPLTGAVVTPEASVLYYRDGHTILARVGITDHSDVPLSAIPEPVRHAVLAAEDREFYGHAGVSARGVVRAVVADAGGKREGASTITQQYARNAFLTQKVTFERKAKEMALAIKLERQYSKDDILGRYLNTIYFGRGAYGIAAAAHAYFGISPERLTFAQGAVLAAVIKDPWKLDPANGPEGARSRWKWIVAAATAQGWLDREAAAGVAYPRVLPRSAGSTALGGPNGTVVDRVEDELNERGISGRTLHTEGLKIVTTIDPVAQPAALKTVAATLRTVGTPPRTARKATAKATVKATAKAGESTLHAALVAVDPATGAVRAYYGGDQGRGFFDDALAPRPAASTFKPIVLAAGLRRNVSYMSRWDGSSPRVFRDRNGALLYNSRDAQCPDCTLRTAMVKSLNTPFYALTEQIGADRVRATAVDLGISASYAGQRSLVDIKGDPRPGHTRADISIGRYPVSPADLATVYATFAAGGVRSTRYFVESVTAANGTSLWRALPRQTRVLSAAAAADVSTVLHAALDRDASPGRPVAGKAGTQQWGNTRDNQDAWMAGYTPQLATTVWLGHSVPGPIRDRAGKAVAGEGAPMRLWRDFLRQSLKGQTALPFPRAARVGSDDAGDADRQAALRRREAQRDALPTGTVAVAAHGDQPVVRTAHAGKRLALTFDDGPSEYTPAMLDLLAAHHVTATFCVVGENVEQYPSLVRRIVDEGHALCNHSTHHDDLGRADVATVRADISTTDRALAAAVPGATVTYFRAPFGSWGESAKVSVELGHTPLGWVVDPDDWTLPGVDTIVSRIEDQLVPRAVVLVHDGGGDRKQTLAALKILIPRLLKQGWTFDLPETSVRSRPLPPAAASATRPSPDTSAPGSASTGPSAGPSSGASSSPEPKPSGATGPSPSRRPGSPDASTPSSDTGAGTPAGRPERGRSRSRDEGPDTGDR